MNVGRKNIIQNLPIGLPAALRARHIALPNEHGAWVFLFTPLAIGLALGGLRPASLLLVASVLAAFLICQPVTIAVKAFSGRRPKTELPAAATWLAIYGVLGLVTAGSLLALGYGSILWLAVPAAPVFAWHLWLVSRRAERRQWLMEIAASGVLALSATAAYWVGRGVYDSTGWLLWALSWLQVAGTILYAYLRLQQRQRKTMPIPREGWEMARGALLYNLAALVLVGVLALAHIVPGLLVLVYLIQPLEVVWGTLHPAVGVKPKIIGIRQLMISLLFTLAFILAWIAK